MWGAGAAEAGLPGRAARSRDLRRSCISSGQRVCQAMAAHLGDALLSE